MCVLIYFVALNILKCEWVSPGASFREAMAGTRGRVLLSENSRWPSTRLSSGMSSGFPPLPTLTSHASFSVSVTLRVQLWGFCSPVEKDGALCHSGLTRSPGWSQIQHKGASVSFSGSGSFGLSLLSPSRERLPLGLAGRDGTLHYSRGQAP